MTHDSSGNISARESVIFEEPDNIISDVADAKSVSSRGSRPKHKSSLNYLAPDEELPCTCLYGSSGNIVFMKPLCPFHGYLVRRNTNYTISSMGFEDEKEEGGMASKRTDSGSQEEDGMDEEEAHALAEEVAKETVEELVREKKNSMSIGSIGSK